MEYLLAAATLACLGVAGSVAFPQDGGPPSLSRPLQNAPKLQAQTRPAPKLQNKPNAAFEQALVTGLTALNNGDLAAARTNLESAAKLQPASPTVWLALAQTYRKLNLQNEAKAAAVKAETLGSSQPVIIRGLVAYYAENDADLTKAATLAEALTAKLQNEPNAAAAAAELWLRAGNVKKTIPLAQRALAHDDLPEVRALLARAFALDGQSSASLTQLRAAAQANPYDESLYFDVAQAFLTRQAFNDALTVLDEGEKIFTKSAQLTLTRGVAYYGLRRFPQAIDAFLRVIAIAPEVEQPYIFLARMTDVAEAKLPGITQALAAFAQAQPDNPLSTFVYAKCLAASSGDPAQIESLLKRSIALNPNTWESHFELAQALEKRPDYPAAAQELERAIQLNPEAAALHFRLARVYDRLGKSAEAAAQRALHAKLTSSPDKIGGASK